MQGVMPLWCPILGCIWWQFWLSQSRDVAFNQHCHHCQLLHLFSSLCALRRLDRLSRLQSAERWGCARRFDEYSYFPCPCRLNSCSLAPCGPTSVCSPQSYCITWLFVTCKIDTKFITLQLTSFWVSDVINHERGVRNGGLKVDRRWFKWREQPYLKALDN